MLTVDNLTISEIRKAITDFSHKEKVILLVYCAELVIDIYENKSDSKAPRLAIEAAKEWIENPTEENKKKCASAAYASAADADAADADAIKTKIIDKINEMKERHDQQVDSSPLCGPDVMKTVEAVNKLRSEWNIEGMPKQNYTPQVGEECEVEYEGKWIKTYIIGIDKDDHYVFELPELEYDIAYDGVRVGFGRFRPLKTERDKLLEQAVSDIVGDSKTEHVSLKDSEQIGKLIDAGWRPTND